VTEFSYRISSGREAHVLVGLAVRDRGEVPTIAAALASQGFAALNLVDDDLAKEHLRYMVGGRSGRCDDERLYRFEFPERPGALMRFLSRMHPNWNISLFHYRNQGADYGRILVGIQIPDADQAAFRAFIDGLGYGFVEETANPVYHLFLR
jgi:threonine dehydratase